MDRLGIGSVLQEEGAKAGASEALEEPELSLDDDYFEGGGDDVLAGLSEMNAGGGGFMAAGGAGEEEEGWTDLAALLEGEEPKDKSSSEGKSDSGRGQNKEGSAAGGTAEEDSRSGFKGFASDFSALLGSAEGTPKAASGEGSGYGRGGPDLSDTEGTDYGELRPLKSLSLEEDYGFQSMFDDLGEGGGGGEVEGLKAAVQKKDSKKRKDGAGGAARKGAEAGGEEGPEEEDLSMSPLQLDEFNFPDLVSCVAGAAAAGTCYQSAPLCAAALLPLRTMVTLAVAARRKAMKVLRRRAAAGRATWMTWASMKWKKRT